MPEVVKSGIFGSDSGAPKKPPAGLEAHCQCGARLKTIIDEEGAELAIRKMHGKKGGFNILGWKMRCPECNKILFFPDPELTKNFFQQTNGYH